MARRTPTVAAEEAIRADRDGGPADPIVPPPAWQEAARGAANCPERAITVIHD